MNDQHPHAGYAGDGAHTTGGYAADPLFGTWSDPGQADHSGQWDLGQYAATGTYDTTGAYETGAWNTTAGSTPGYDTTGQWDTTAQWATATDAYPAGTSYGQPEQYDTTGQWDASAWTEAQHTGQFENLHSGAYAAQGAYGHEAYDTTGQWAAPAFATDTGAYDATAWNQAADPAEPLVPQQYVPQAEHVDRTSEFAFPYEQAPEPETAAYEPESAYEADTAYEAEAAYGTEAYEPVAYDDAPGHEDPEGPAGQDGASDAPVAEVRTDAVAGARPVRRSSGGSRSRRRTPAKRSALLTVAVPSACVMGVAGIAAASVGGLTGGATESTKQKDTTALAADSAAVQQIAANTALDTQLSALDADVRDFGDRASRTQERIDLKARQAADKKKREEEAARKEAMRPKFALPVKLHQLSARFGQSGVNWMSVHTGIDFPVMTGTPVMAATDGTVRTQLNYAYGNMVIVTAPDGTETWYCHLSSAKIRTGSVKAGDVIAYSGDSGNSTGPHLHFEVRPGGGSAIDPLAWLRSKGLNPTG
ncbi:peptidoglycan DD-metalloendopeptidase family protein [Streptomyces hydrogenans]|uniref:M23 family metallopeptidase n=1 Tax=Streptomyces hydrogenans TaxID=1873719 RepID=UPI0035DBE781